MPLLLPAPAVSLGSKVPHGELCGSRDIAVHIPVSVGHCAKVWVVVIQALDSKTKASGTQGTP